jgi:hypothetical protein
VAKMTGVRVATLLVAAAVQAAQPAAAAGQIRIMEGDVGLTLSGYVRALTGIHDRGYDVPEGLPLAGSPRETGFHGEVLRLKWELGGNGWEIDVHDRFQARFNTGGGETPAVGFGVSAVPDRLDLETEIMTSEGLRVWHDLDRLALTVYTDAADVTVGRQPITWGISSIFPVADLWAQFSPFELDTEEKPGIDAARVLFYPADRLEMDAIAAARCQWTSWGSRCDDEDLSVGVRGTYGLPSADVWLGAGKFWREVMAMGGVTFLLDEIRLRAEAAFPWDLDDGSALDPRATAGVDWIRGTLVLTGEYHFNGLGTRDPDGYLARIQTPPLQRGETYYVGRHYLGGLVAWSPDAENRLNLALNGLANLGDGSVAVTPVLTYDIGQSTNVSVGGLASLGDAPVFQPAPRLRSEFGAYGDLFFTRLSVYF